jgi:hypothetical protein
MTGRSASKIFAQRVIEGRELVLLGISAKKFKTKRVNSKPASVPLSH